MDFNTNFNTDEVDKFIVQKYIEFIEDMDCTAQTLHATPQKIIIKYDDHYRGRMLIDIPMLKPGEKFILKCPEDKNDDE